jgi:hypothetical protein
MINSPLLTIWFQPRATFRRLLVLNNPSSYIVHSILIIGGFASFLMRFTLELGFISANISLKLIMCLFMGAAFAYFEYLIMSRFYQWSGKKLNGKATLEEIRSVILWSYLPELSSLIIFIPIFLLYILTWGGINLFVFWGFQVVTLIIVLWAILIRIKAIAEAHQFSSWRALLTICLGSSMFMLIFVIPILLIALAAALICVKYNII